MALAQHSPTTTIDRDHVTPVPDSTPADRVSRPGNRGLWIPIVALVVVAIVTAVLVSQANDTDPATDTSFDVAEQTRQQQLGTNDTSSDVAEVIPPTRAR